MSFYKLWCDILAKFYNIQFGLSQGLKKVRPIRDQSKKTMTYPSPHRASRLEEGKVGRKQRWLQAAWRNWRPVKISTSRLPGGVSGAHQLTSAVLLSAFINTRPGPRRRECWPCRCINSREQTVAVDRRTGLWWAHRLISWASRNAEDRSLDHPTPELSPLPSAPLLTSLWLTG